MLRWFIPGLLPNVTDQTARCLAPSTSQGLQSYLRRLCNLTCPHAKYQQNTPPRSCEKNTAMWAAALYSFSFRQVELEKHCKVIIMFLWPTSYSRAPVESQSQALFSVDAASLLLREQNRREPVCAPWPPTPRSVPDSLLFSSRDVSIESIQNQPCHQKLLNLIEKEIILLLGDRWHFPTG